MVGCAGGSVGIEGPLSVATSVEESSAGAVGSAMLRGASGSCFASVK